MTSANLLERLLNIIVPCLSSEMHSHGMLSALNFEDRWWGRKEGRIHGEILNSQRGRHDDQLQGLMVRILRRQLCSKLNNSAEHTNENIGVGASFVSFVDDDRGVLHKLKVLRNLAHQNTISHELHGCLGVNSALETNLVGHRLRLVSKFLSNSLRHTDRSDSTGLRDTDQSRRGSI